MSTVSDMTVGLYGVPSDEVRDDATQSFDELELVVVEVTTGDGVTGTGFTYTIGEGGAAVATFVDTTLRPVVVGESAAPQSARDRLRAATTFVGREGISELGIAAVDIALWDTLGRRHDAPLYELLGGERTAVPAYQTDGGWLGYDRETLVENAGAAAAAGFAGFKMKVGRSPAADAARVRAVREVLPSEVDLMLDANCSYSVAEARRLATRLRDVPVAWLEEPVEKGDYSGHAALRDAVDVPIATGENLYGEAQFGQAVAAGAADVLQPDVCRVGGVSGWLAVAGLARARNLPVSPHYIEPLHVHLVAAADDVPYVEHHSTVLDGVLVDPLTADDGRLHPPDESGHGMQFEGLDAHEKPFRNAD